MILDNRSLARNAMIRFRGLGLNPIPSRSDHKAPQVPYAAYWTSPGPDEWIDRPCRNVQVMTGVFWRLAVLDLDGPTAIEIYRSWSRFRETPVTWESAHSLELGRHLWYSLPPGLASCPSRFVWELAGAKHEAVEILGDGKLVMAPPSIHPKIGRRYRWLPGRSPRTLPRPAMIPDWLLTLPSIRPISVPSVARPTLKPLTPRVAVPGKSYHSRTVLDAIADKASLAASWGLRLSSRPANANGWLLCHAVDRDDRSPSAGFHERTGYYSEPHVCRLSLFDLSVELGAYATWEDARDDLGRRYC